MMSNFSKKKKEYLRITSRFLKEVGLYSYWRKYCYDPHGSKTWIKREDEHLGVTDILGLSNFTSYLSQHGVDIQSERYCAYEYLGEYIKKMHPQYAEEVKNSTKNKVCIDRDKKKIWLIGLRKCPIRKIWQ